MQKNQSLFSEKTYAFFTKADKNLSLRKKIKGTLDNPVKKAIIIGGVNELEKRFYIYLYKE